jgi:hypothetical protein
MVRSDVGTLSLMLLTQCRYTTVYCTTTSHLLNKYFPHEALMTALDLRANIRHSVADSAEYV